MSSDFRLGDIAEINMGQSPAGENCNSTGNGLPLLNGPTEFGSKHPHPVQFTTETKKLAESGDLLFCVRGSTTGRMNWADQTYVIGRGIAAIRGKNGYPNSFIRAAIESNLDSLLIQATGSTFPNVSRDLISSLTIAATTPEVAAEIASILEPIDDRIALLRETNTTLEAIAQALFKSWFVDFDPVHAKQQGREPEGMDAATAALFPDSFEESELGLVPSGWHSASLSDVSFNHSESFDFNAVEKVVFVNTGDVSEGQFLHKNYSDKNNLPGQAKKSIHENDILFSEIRPKNKRFAYVNFDSKDYVVSTKFMVLRPKSEMPPRYLYQVLRQEESIEYFNMIAESRSGTFPQITFDSIAKLVVIKPSLKCMEKYLECVLPIFKKIDLIMGHLKALEDLRDTLLPRLISGQLRLPEAKALIAETEETARAA